MKSQAQPVQKKVVESSGLQQIHQQKLRQDHKVLFRKILIWLFAFVCLYIAFMNDAQTSVPKAQPSVSQRQSIPSEQVPIETLQQAQLNEIEVTASETNEENQEEKQVSMESQTTLQQTINVQQLDSQIQSQLQTGPTPEQSANESEENPQIDTTQSQI